jgi:hypothetical protein
VVVAVGIDYSVMLLDELYVHPLNENKIELNDKFQ